MPRLHLFQTPVGRACGALPDPSFGIVFARPHRVPGGLHRGAGRFGQRPPVLEV